MKLSTISKNLLITLPILALGACSSTAKLDSEAETQQVVEQTAEPVVEAMVQAEVVEPIKALTEEELMVQQYGDAILKHAIQFDFDKSEIKPEFTTPLQAHAAYLKEHSDKLISIEGYADEKGTPEYNIELGKRRALAVAAYLENHGVSASQINTVSFGEEKPVNTAHNESAWIENRRAELVY